VNPRWEELVEREQEGNIADGSCSRW